MFIKCVAIVAKCVNKMAKKKQQKTENNLFGNYQNW